MNPEKVAAKTERGATGEAPVWTFEEFSTRVSHRKLSLLAFAKNLIRTSPGVSPEDLVSTTIEKALKGYATYKVTGETEESRAHHLAAWTTRILRNTWLDLVRKMKRHGERPMPEGFDLEGPGENPERMRIINNLLDQALKGIEQLPQEQREALMLFAAEGMSHDEIAAWQQVPVGTVKSRISRARKALGGSSTLDED